MQALPYSAWADTAHTLHMLLQMMGKIKLRLMPAQPEWNHTLLHMTPSGFTTGLIPHGNTSFDIHYDIAASTVSARCTTGLSASFPVRGEHSVAEYYARFRHMLAAIGHDTRFTVTPQEVPNTNPFPKQTDAHAYDVPSARAYFETCVFAHNALLTFAAPLRTKKILPSLFWGTFDMTTVLFSGRDEPFGGQGIIEQVAFDEQFIEFGYWPGDPKVDAPSFFALPYPFLTQNLTGAPVSPKSAYYSPEKKEFFLPLAAVLEEKDPMAAVRQFCEDVFAVVTKAEGWANVDWFVKPLLC